MTANITPSRIFSLYEIGPEFKDFVPTFHDIYTLKILPSNVAKKDLYTFKMVRKRRVIPCYPKLESLCNDDKNFNGYSDALDIDIIEDTLVEIRLHNSAGWIWSNKFVGIATKDTPRNHFYGGLKYKKDINSGTFSTRGHDEYDPKTDRFRAIQFQAKRNYNNCGEVAELHPVVFNVDFMQNVDGKFPYLPITIDPDVRNPPVITPGMFLSKEEHEEFLNTARQENHPLSAYLEQ